jgi:DNA-binding NarL/FixJ family response regulator
VPVREPPSRIEVVVAEDDLLFAAALVDLLETDERVDVVGRARNGAEAVELAERLHPDVVVMDIEMPVVDGIEATRRLRDSGNPAKVFVLTASESAETRRRALEAGAAGYLRKSDSSLELLGALPDRQER